MKKLEFKEIQGIANDILKHIKEVCDANSINYYLAYGTVIGAVRHKGFIPWDDDIDIYMPREDFNKFLDVISKEQSHYKIMSIDTDPEYPHPLTKLVDTRTKMDWHIVKHKVSYGIWVDIYILDNVPDDDAELRRFQRKLNFYQKCYEHALYNMHIHSLKSLLSNIGLCWTKLFGPRFFAEKMYRMSPRYNNIETKRFAPSAFTAQSRAQAVLRKDILGKGVDMSFECVMYRVPEKTDEYLRHFYNDYMKLPPVEKRVSNHTADFYLLED